MKRGICKNILYSNAIKLIESMQVVVIDLRDETEEKEKVLPLSINISINELMTKVTKLVPDRNQPILVYCSTGSRSIFACQILANLGYQKVYNLQGGIL